MEVASATSVAPRATAFLTALDGGKATGQGGRTLSDDDKVTSLSEQRYTRVALFFNSDVSRLVLQFRDPDTGKTVEQIPSEAVLKQYEEAQKERSRAKNRLQLIVGGEQGTGTGEEYGAGSTRLGLQSVAIASGGGVATTGGGASGSAAGGATGGKPGTSLGGGLSGGGTPGGSSPGGNSLGGTSLGGSPSGSGAASRVALNLVV